MYSCGPPRRCRSLKTKHLNRSDAGTCEPDTLTAGHVYGGEIVDFDPDFDLDFGFGFTVKRTGGIEMDRRTAMLSRAGWAELAKLNITEGIVGVRSAHRQLCDSQHPSPGGEGAPQGRMRGFFIPTEKLQESSVFCHLVSGFWYGADCQLPA